MTHQELLTEQRWLRAESRLIAESAREAGFTVSMFQVYYSIATWRDWFYGLITPDQVTRLTGIRQTADAAV